jgi:hypothetical protein
MYDQQQTLADLAAASTRMRTDVQRATAAVRRTHSTVTRADLTLNDQTGQGFHVGGHAAATPVAGSDGSAAQQAITRLHRTFVVPTFKEPVAYITPGERDVALAHAQAGCGLCRAFLSGAARGAAGGAKILSQRAARPRRSTRS